MLHNKFQNSTLTLGNTQLVDLSPKRVVIKQDRGSLCRGRKRGYLKAGRNRIGDLDIRCAGL